MKAVPYSPFNKTYKYLCLQHGLAHSKNKKDVKGLVQSNLQIEKNSKSLHKASKTADKTSSSFVSYRSVGDGQKGSLKYEPLVIHRDSRYSSRKKQDILKQNQRMQRKLSQTKCRVIPYNSTENFFTNSQIYKSIAMKFDDKAKHKELIYFTNPSLLQSMALSNASTNRYLCKTSSSNKRKK